MAMKNGVLSSGVGHQQFTEYNLNGTIKSDVFTFGWPRHQKYLSDLQSVNNGDYRTPNGHRYNLTITDEWEGIELSKRPQGGVNWIRKGMASKTLAHSLGPPGDFSPTAYNRALGKISDMTRGDMDLSIDLVQWRQVADMINIRKRLVNGMQATLRPLIGKIDNLERDARTRYREQRTRNRIANEFKFDRSQWYRSRAKELANEMASKRLEYMYGWLPSAGSICDLGAEFADSTRSWNSALRVSGTGYDRYDYTVNVFPAEVRVNKKQYRCKIVMYLTAPPNVLLAQAARIASLNPVSIAYEATPFSFVVDWFVDIGGWIRETETSIINSARFQSGYISQGYRGRSTLTSRQDTPTFYQDLRASIEIKSFRRQRLVSYPFPRRPAFKPNLGTGQLLNAAALLQVNSRRIDEFIRKWR